GDTSGWGSDSSGFSSTGGIGNGWANPSKMMLRFFHPTASNYGWAESIHPGASITSSRINVDTAAKSYIDFNVSNGAVGTPSHLLNAYEALAATFVVGMHYIDVANNLVYYRPR